MSTLPGSAPGRASDPAPGPAPGLASGTAPGTAGTSAPRTRASVHPLHARSDSDPTASQTNNPSADSPTPASPQARWSDAQLILSLLALDPIGLGGVHLIAAPGPARDRWLTLLHEAHDPTRPLRRLPQHADESRLLGGLDLTTTLRTGRPVLQPGLLAEADGQILLCPMAERLTTLTVFHLCQALDHGHVRVERDGVGSNPSARLAVIALDESSGDEGEPGLSPALAERLAFRLDLQGIDWRTAGVASDVAMGDGDAATHNRPASAPSASDRLLEARQRLTRVELPEAVLESLTHAALALGIESMRTPWWAAQATRALAALRGLDEPGPQEVVDAARLVLGPLARRLPPSESQPQEEAQSPDREPEDAADQPPDDHRADSPPPELPPDTGPAPSADIPDAQDLTVAAIQAALPAGLLALLARQQGLSPSRGAREAASRAGQAQRGGQHGRPIGVRPGTPGQGYRLSLIDTLRQAAPWQRLRQATGQPTGQSIGQPIGSSANLPRNPASDRSRHHTPLDNRPPPRIRVAREDLRVIVREPRRPSTTVFIVDASGSNALNRLAEAKGAVESLLADCYVRRDRVAVIGFRGQQADTLLPPTRSLVRAKRSLAGLPGGGGTPMARALQEAQQLGLSLARRGDTVSLVLLTDGKANVTLEGRPGREQAHAEAIHAARSLAAHGLRCLLIDTSPKPQAMARELALAMAARYVPLPQARTGEIGRIVRNTLAA